MNALLFTNLFPTASEPTRGIFTLQIARELARLCALRVAVPLPWFPGWRWAHDVLPDYGRRFGSVGASADSAGIHVSFPRYPLLPKVSENQHARLMWLGVRGHIEALHRSFGLDVINAHWLYPDGVVAARIATKLGIPSVLTALGCDVNDALLVGGLRAQILSALRSATAVTTVSSQLAEALLGEGVQAERIHVIPNGVDTKQFKIGDARLTREALGLDPAGPIVVCVSRLSAEKGVHHLIAAATVLHKRLPGLTIAIVGDGQERSSLERQALSSGVRDVVRFVGAVAHHDVATWLTAATVVCMPSVREGHPNAAMEALASGRPLVASRVGALPSMISAVNGILVPPGEPGLLADALLNALSRAWVAEQIRQSVSAASWLASARAYAEVFGTAVTSSIRPRSA